MLDYDPKFRIRYYHSLVAQVRDRTGAGYLQCLKGIYKTKGDVEKAVSWVRENPGFYI
jgi:translation elongation factor EF-Ts